MNLLKSLSLKRFQCHSDLTIPLADVTVLVGDNDSGKTAVLRALEWVALNQWDGKADEQIQWGCQYCEVTLCSDKDTVRRTRGNSLNYYHLNDEEYKAFGQKVPEPIVKSLMLCDDNFARQWDSPFWLAMNAPQAAQALNEIFNLSDIDIISSNAASDVRAARTKVSVLEASLARARGLEQEFAWAEKADKELKELEALDLRVEGLKEDEVNLGNFLTQLESGEEEVKENKELLALALAALAAGESLASVEEKIARVNKVTETEGEVCRLKEALKVKEQRLQKFLAGACPLCNRSG